ncbi:MAG: hypothetical protein ACU84H_11890 [Gammaproteobacteria bacterium]
MPILSFGDEPIIPLKPLNLSGLIGLFMSEFRHTKFASTLRISLKNPSPTAALQNPEYCSREMLDAKGRPLRFWGVSRVENS